MTSIDYIDFYLPVPLNDESSAIRKNINFYFDDYVLELRHFPDLSLETVGKLWCKAGSMAMEEGERVLQAFESFFLFLNRLERTSLCLQAYKDGRMIYHNGQREKLRCSFIHSWLPAAQQMNELWGMFWYKWNQSANRHILDISMCWYLQALHHPEVETAIMITRSVFELLGTTIKRQKLAFPVRIEALLKKFNIMLEIPPTFHALTGVGLDQKNMMGPRILTFIQDLLGQAGSQQITKLSPLARQEALQLSLYYIEQILLCYLSSVE